MSMSIRFLGAARNVTGSKYLLRCGSSSILVDCGLYQERELRGRNWEPLDNCTKEFEDPLWTQGRRQAAGTGHGGADFFVLRAFLDSVRSGGPAPIDAYDAAAWSSIIPLSAKSIAEGNRPQEIPDFTKGKWEARRTRNLLPSGRGRESQVGYASDR